MTNEDNVSVGARVRSLRIAAGLTQDQLAQSLRSGGLKYANQSTVSRVELGTRDLTYLEAVQMSEWIGFSLSGGEEIERVASLLAETRACIFRAQDELRKMP